MLSPQGPGSDVFRQFDHILYLQCLPAVTTYSVGMRLTYMC